MAEPNGGGERVRVQVGGRTLTVSSLSRVVYPATGTTKGEVLHHYASVAPILLPHLAGRPVTRVRYPQGVAAPGFFEKNLPAGAPGWVPRVTIDDVTYPLVDGPAVLTWLANTNALELHVPQWRVEANDGGGAASARGGAASAQGGAGSARGGAASAQGGDQGRVPRLPDRLVIDLDPGPPSGLEACAEVAMLVRDRLTPLGLTLHPVTSGSKGMQLYAGLGGDLTSDQVRDLAQQLAQELSERHPSLVVWRMTKSLRPGKVLLDWSQNVAAKTTISPYSLRGRAVPMVACPRTWDEVEAGAAGRVFEQVMFEDLPARLDEHGDLLADLA